MSASGDAHSGDGPGTVVLSIDAELGWGFHHRDPVPADRIRAARECWRRLLDRLDDRGIPATWAVVGHLLLAECRGGHVDHPAGADCCQPSPAAADERGPAESHTTESPWFGRDLVAAVRDADAPHELASHGFTHVHFRHEAMDRAFAARELRASRAAAEELGEPPASFVFPVNEVAHRDLLAEYGFDCYRGRSPADPGGGTAATIRRRGRKLLSAAGRWSPPLVEPRLDEHGLVDVPASLYLFGFDGPARALVARVREDPVVAAVRRGLDRLASEGGVLHLWLHPHNLAAPPGSAHRVAPAADARMRAVLDAVVRARSRDGVRVETMRDVAARVRETAPEVG